MDSSQDRAGETQDHLHQGPVLGRPRTRTPAPGDLGAGAAVGASLDVGLAAARPVPDGFHVIKPGPPASTNPKAAAPEFRR